jgi:glycosyltransferase involved in cell wall biosynthesis
LHPHKNLDRLIRAYARQKRDYKLVLAGMRGFHTAKVEALIAELGVSDSVELKGWIPRSDLLRLYERARAFIYPSTFEGFGMPVLEAMAAGLPVACSDIPPLREVAGDSALYFDPLDESAIATALDQVIHATPNGRERARSFRWETSAEKTLEALTI